MFAHMVVLLLHITKLVAPPMITISATTPRHHHL
jgi:hypothetical protein